ncbi:hypothetical protein E1293_24135 [Actinomadura darangshiensis]|uniref:Uncharacterized protein n=1 Tax=Actinomadura darangshiensis TaxID=705336 RepID=A0A4R5AZW6_9ACTN|nr:hypothetical protein [Actinomadura darangshiensis]TDD79178.1 hypothetical protein E1293_24135 [Actinomadura darangshiensis]
MLTYLVVVLWLLAVILVLAACVGQRKLWWRTHAWRFRDPQGREPSGAALVAGRVAKLALAAVLVAATFLVNGPVRAALSADQQRDVEMLALQAAVSLPGGPLEITYSALQPHVHKTFSDAIRGRAALTEGDPFTDGDRSGLKFELTDTDGDHPVCLTVTVHRLPESSALRAVITMSTTMAKGHC